MKLILHQIISNPPSKRRTGLSFIPREPEGTPHGLPMPVFRQCWCPTTVAE
jgi:hypothetical protein